MAKDAVSSNFHNLFIWALVSRGPADRHKELNIILNSPKILKLEAIMVLKSSAAYRDSSIMGLKLSKLGRSGAEFALRRISEDLAKLH
jgi:hypothetical protein